MWNSESGYGGTVMPGVLKCAGDADVEDSVSVVIPLWTLGLPLSSAPRRLPGTIIAADLAELSFGGAASHCIVSCTVLSRVNCPSWTDVVLRENKRKTRFLL